MDRSDWPTAKSTLGEEKSTGDIQYWLTRPVEERLAAVWELTLQVYPLVPGGKTDEPGLSRSTAHVIRP